MDATLMERAFTFPQRATDSARMLSFEWSNIGDPDDFEYEIVRECAERGRDACNVAAALRKNGKFVPLESDFVDHLNKKVAEIEKADRERRELKVSSPFPFAPPPPPTSETS